MVRSGLCPYMYICCHHMTVMFRAAGVLRGELHAVLTPTTRGIRAALDSDGKYRLPLSTAVNSLLSLGMKLYCIVCTTCSVCSGRSRVGN